MVTVVSPRLLAVDAEWDDDAGAGAWIADRLGPFGPSVGHAVPLGYAASAGVPIPPEDEPWDNRGSVPVVEAIADVLDPFTGDQPVHFGMWDGWSWWYDTGTDPRTAAASPEAPKPSGKVHLRPQRYIGCSVRCGESRRRLYALGHRHRTCD
jgi:hypothetical protein